MSANPLDPERLRSALAAKLRKQTATIPFPSTEDLEALASGRTTEEHRRSTRRAIAIHPGAWRAYALVRSQLGLPPVIEDEPASDARKARDTAILRFPVHQLADAGPLTTLFSPMRLAADDDDVESVSAGVTVGAFRVLFKHDRDSDQLTSTVRDAASGMAMPGVHVALVRRTADPDHDGIAFASGTSDQYGVVHFGARAPMPSVAPELLAIVVSSGDVSE